MTQKDINKRADAYMTGGAKALRAERKKQESEYTDAEKSCKGCMGPCGMCEELSDEHPPLRSQGRQTTTTP